MWKIQLPIAINFISSKDNDEDPVMHSKNDNKEIISNYKADKVIKFFFKSLPNRYPSEQEDYSKVVSLSSIKFIYCIINVIK